MIQQQLYICEKCGTSYANEKDCQMCERGHKPAMRIRSQKYVPIGVDCSGYPSYVL